MKSSNIGGQAVLEGIMMKNRDHYAVAVRKPDGEIFVQTEEFHSVTGRYKKLTTIPFIRGVFNFIDFNFLTFCKKKDSIFRFFLSIPKNTVLFFFY